MVMQFLKPASEPAQMEASGLDPQTIPRYAQTFH